MRIASPCRRTLRRVACGLWSVTFFASLSWAAGRSAAPGPIPDNPVLPQVRERAKQTLGKTPLYFEPNQGQAGSEVLAVGRGGGFLTMLTGPDTVYLNGNTSEPVRMQLMHAGKPANVVFEDKLAGVSNYFFGKDPSKWRSGVPHYGKVRLEGVYPGVDLVYYSAGQRMEYDFVVAPGANPRQIRMSWSGTEKIQIDDKGDLVLSTAAGDIRHKRPVIYQQVDGVRVPVRGHYVETGDNTYAFELGEYRKELALVIDPTIYYSTYLGGSMLDDPLAITVDGNGNSYVAGTTRSNDFPLKTPVQGGPIAGTTTAFITKVTTSGTELFYSTFLGGEREEQINAIALDNSGNVYVAGETSSSDFPVSMNAYHTFLRGQVDGFATKISAAGNQIVYSTYIGEFDADDRATALDVDAGGNAVVAGYTTAFNFTTTEGAYDRSYNGAADIWLLKLDAKAENLVFSTFFGGTSHDIPRMLVLDLGGEIYLTGYTNSSDFPVTPGAHQTVMGGIQDGFLARFSQSGKNLVFSTFVGGTGQEVVFALALEPGGRLLVTGQTTSTDFPTTPGAYQSNMRGVTNAFLCRYNSVGSKLIASTLLGSQSVDYGAAVRPLDAGYMIIGGFSNSNSFPFTPDAWQFSSGFAGDGFVAIFTPLANSLFFSSILGGGGEDAVRAFGQGPTGDIYVAGITASGVPINQDSYDPSFNGVSDGFLMRLNNFGIFECVSSVNPSATDYPLAGGAGGIGVSGSFCPWYAFSSVPWVTLTSNPLTQGGGSLNYSVAANPSADPRTAIVQVAGNQIHIVQKGSSTLAPFTDVLNNDPFVDYVRIIKNRGVTSGCSATEYCPNANTTRGQMAVFIVRSLVGSDDFIYPAAPYFTDVPATHPFFKWIQKLRQLNITQGCNLVEYCPDRSVTRGEMAAFLIRAKYGNNFTYPLTQFFTDVSPSYLFYPHIQKLRQTGTTLGCTATTYCVDNATTRLQMAAFLTRMFLTPW